ncbi:MAG: von Willebrand factor type A domain-containing protein, partial [Thermodesulfobacteriota bacterium]
KTAGPRGIERDKKELEKKLKGLEIPPPDGERKETILRAALKEFEERRDEVQEEGKGSDVAGRLTGKRGRKSFFKGGPVMTRPIYVTISLAVVAVFVAYTLHYYPGMAPIKNDFSRAPVRTEQDRVSQGPAVHTDQPAVAGREVTPAAEPSAKPVTAPARKQVAKQGGDDTKGAPSSVVGAGGTVSDERLTMARTVEEAVAPPATRGKTGEMRERDSVGDRGKTKVSKSEVKRRQAGIYRSNAVGKKEQFSGYAAQAPAPAQVKSLTEAERNISRREYAGRDRFERLEQNPVKLTQEAPVSTFSIDVDTASYAFVRRSLHQGHLPQKDAVRVEELINYFDYDYTAPKSRRRPFKPTVAVYPTPWNTGTKLLHIGIKGHEMEQKERPRANLVFLIDVSGSMSSPDKLPLLKNSMKMLVNELEPEDTVAIAVYAGAAGTVLEPTKVKDKGRIVAALERLRSGGSTAGGAGIKLAYALAESSFDEKAVNRVILATDGDFNVGIRNSDELKGFVERKRKSGIYLSVLGFGQGNYNDELMQKLAQNGNGNAAYIDTLNEARKVLVEEAGATLFTIAKDVKIQVEFNPDRVAEYRLIGYESRMLKREDFNNDRVDAGDVGAGHSVTAIYEITPVGSESQLVDPLRYSRTPRSSKAVKGGEYAFLKIRYKLPHEDESRLITKAIGNDLEYGSIKDAPTDVRFAAAVAAFGQLLKGGRYTEEFGYDDVRTLAEGSRGRDRFGYRSEFLSLVGLAETASTMGDR